MNGNIRRTEIGKYTPKTEFKQSVHEAPSSGHLARL